MYTSSSGKFQIGAATKPTYSMEKIMKRKRCVQWKNKYKYKIEQTILVKFAMYICVTDQV